MSFAFPTPISLVALCAAVDAELKNADGVVVGGMSQDSRHVQPGDLYCCVRGEKFDGHQFVNQAIAAGAVALLVDNPLDNVPFGIAVVQVSDVRSVLGVIASEGFGHPSKTLTMVGITGTNGKTSTAAILGSILQADGRDVRVLGTLTGERTTPEAIALQSILCESVSNGVTHVVMEVSSHALHQGRVNGIQFAVSVFTNFARDHLDFHGTEENYFAAKALLFTPSLCKVGVINIDDPRGQLIVDVGNVQTIPFSREDATEVDLGVDYTRFIWRHTQLVVPMGGKFTLMNALAAATAADVLEVPLTSIAQGCSSLIPVSGRFESVKNDLGIGVIVDYAHTPDGLAEVLSTARELTTGDVITVFGCGGNRDHGKRPLMGEIAARMATRVYVTSDNPRNEDPQMIVDEILSGISEPKRSAVHVEIDRAIAITSAISVARRGDIVVIAGKGHETTQEINGVLSPFSDVRIAAQALEERKRVAP